MADVYGEDAREVSNVDGGGNNFPITIEDGQDGSGLKAKVQQKVTGENAVHVIGSDATAPDNQVVYFVDHVANGGSTEFAVNGSVTPVVFTAPVPAGQIWYLDELKIYIQDGGNINANAYGGITSGLTNGVLIEFQINSIDYTYFNMKTNLDITDAFPQEGLIGSSSGFLNTNKAFIGTTTFAPKIALTGDDGDLIRVTVRDNLVGLDFHEMSFKYHRIIP
jgi:hypothetical protein